MGIFDRFFKDDEKREKMFWNIISLESTVDDIIEISHHKPQVIFKHSNQCGTSFFAKRNLENIKKDTFENVDFYLIDVIQDRIVSRYLDLLDRTAQKGQNYQESRSECSANFLGEKNAIIVVTLGLLYRDELPTSKGKSRRVVKF